MVRRYAQVFPSPARMLVANALALSYAHVNMHNWIAVVFSTIGSLMCASTYLRTQSTAAATIEHAL